MSHMCLVTCFIRIQKSDRIKFRVLKAKIDLHLAIGKIMKTKTHFYNWECGGIPIHLFMTTAMYTDFKGEGLVVVARILNL